MEEVKKKRLKRLARLVQVYDALELSSKILWGLAACGAIVVIVSICFFEAKGVWQLLGATLSLGILAWVATMLSNIIDGVIFRGIPK